ncbi:MAG: 5-formyltetrahydrofolate cyclo-ligase [Janthinobacterium lividum]
MARSIARTETALPPSFGSKAALRAVLLARRQRYVDSDCGAADAVATVGAHQTLAQRIESEITATRTHSLGFYWPLPGEFDARALVGDWLRDATHCAALPVVTDPAGPLAFHRWTPTAAMRAGRYGIAVPAQAIDLTPAVLLIPCVGFDAARYRLGYGGGFYDRTLAALRPRPFTIGIAYECLRIESLPREPHDLPLDVILTESARYA